LKNRLSQSKIPLQHNVLYLANRGLFSLNTLLSLVDRFIWQWVYYPEYCRNNVASIV